MSTGTRARTAFTIGLIIALIIIAVAIYPPGGMP